MRFLSFLLAFSFAVISLEAHGPNCKCHLAPGQVVPPNGGVLEFSDCHIWVELIDDADPMQVYLYEADLEHNAIDHVEIKAAVRLPRRSKAKADVELVRDGDRYLAEVSLEGRVHRYTLEFDLTHDGDRSITSFDIEP